MRYLRTNTATRITVGPFLDKTDGITPEISLTVTSELLTFVVDTGGVPTLVIDAAPTASGGNNDMVHITSDAAGYYDLELTAAQTNYLGRAVLSLNDVATHLPVFHEFMIIPAMMYDSMILGTDRLDTNVTHAVDTAWASGAITANSIASNALANAKFADGAITAAKFAANAITSTVVADNTITAAKIASAALAIAKFATDVGTTAYASNPIAQAVCERLVSAMTTAGSLGERIERLDILAAGGAGELTAARAGYLANLSAGAVALASALATAQTDLDTLTDDWANGGRLDLILDAILAMLNDARTEPGDTAPPVNPDAMTKLDYLYKFLRNKIETTSTRIHVYNDAGDNIDHSSVISDDATTFTRGEFAAGD